MRLTTLFSFLPALALATPVFFPRQAQTARIVAVSASGSGCPPDTWVSSVTEDGQSTTVGLNDYVTVVGPGANPQEREKTCDISLTVNFPLGCRNVAFGTTYHGFAELNSGVGGTFRTQHSLSPGQLTGGNPPATTYSGSTYSAGATYTKFDATSGRVNINSANQRNVSLIVRTRLFLIAGSSSQSGIFTADDATISITQQTTC